ncbi:MAG: hypothetical protein IJV95_02045 [Clostridia bacterium]|nr:hypothetical protein [Clostridia bacterium]
MLGIVISGTTVSMQTAGKNIVVYDLAKGNNGEGAAAWSGFSSSNVNITFSFDSGYLGGAQYAMASFDTLGGVALNADSVSNFTLA